MSDSFLHSLVLGVFIVFITVAGTVFQRNPGGAGRDPRAALFGILLWGFVWSTFLAVRPAPLPLLVLAMTVLGASLLLFFWAVHSIRGKMFSYAYTEDAPQFLHTSGPYAYVRNPIYDSYLLGTIGSLLMWPTWISAAIAAAFVLYINNLAKFEERKFASSPVSDDYERYRARTGRLLPRFFGVTN
jgi:protein-S-isoprenylcysteine O-methyltransferase Ste14